MRFKRWLAVALGIIVLLWGAKFLLLDTAASPAGSYVIDIEALHRRATASGGLPSRIEVERIADFAFPRSFVLAGEGFRLHPMVLLSHRVVWPDRSLIIDSAVSPKARSLPGAKLHAAAFQRMAKALGKADSILFTHEHPDHVGGVASTPELASIASKVQITAEQLDSPQLEREEFAPGALARFKPLRYRGQHSVAPGVVLQQAPGHTAGTQLIYVELASGARYLFVGDIAWSEDNLRAQRGRPRLAGLMIGEDRPAVAAQVRALAALPKRVHLVVSHDAIALRRDLAAGLFHEGFSE